MKQHKLLYLVPLLLFCIAAGCGQRRHNREKKEIEKERAQERSQTADLSAAVNATDEAGWDSVVAFRQFYDDAHAKLAADRRRLAAFKSRISKGYTKVPVLYRASLCRLQRRTLELEQRLMSYNHSGKDSWDDFTRLYSYDLLQLEKDIAKLEKKGRKNSSASGSK